MTAVHNAESEPESLEKEASHMLGEARMVLPGMQALFGFQLIAVYNQSFSTLLSSDEQLLHLAGLLLTAAAIALLMTPAAYHRQAEPHQISRTFLQLSSRLLTLGMFALMLSIEVNCYLISHVILKRKLVSGVIAAGLGLWFLGLWFAFPRWARHRARTNGPAQ